MRHHILNLLIFSFLLTACAATQTPATIPATQLPTGRLPTHTTNPTFPLTPTLPAFTATPGRTATIQRTGTPAPTVTPVPTSTPYGPFSASGPHLAYIVNTTRSGRALTILNADASGREIIPIPDDVIVDDLNIALSPNGEWLAFHTGSAGTNEEWGKVKLAPPLDLTLKLMHLPDGKITTISGLLSKDYPANIDKTAALLLQTDPRYSEQNLDTAEGIVGENFIWGIQGMDWSPDSRSLAFSGEMDGPTSDLYVYDTQNSQINRLTDGNGEMTGAISWSSDGKWILHGSDNEPPGEGTTTDLYAVRSDGTDAKKIANSTDFGVWISPVNIVLHESANVTGDHDLRIINVETGEVKLIWSDSFEDYAFDQNTGSFAICGGSSRDPDLLPWGIYLFQPDKQRQYISADYSCSVTYRGTPSHQFIDSDMYSDSGGVFAITQDGKLEPIKQDANLMGISPDNNWMILSSKKCGCSCDDYCTSNLELYDKNDAFVRELATFKPDLFFWRPDGQGIYYKDGALLFYMGIPDHEPGLVDVNLDPHATWGFNYLYRWVR